MLEELQIRVLNLQFAATSKAAMEKNSTALSMDESAFDVFYKQTSRALLRYLVAVTRQPDVAEDILQEAYCRLLTAGRPEMDEQQTRSYLFRIATNLVRDRWRRGKESPLPQNSEEISPMDPEFDDKLHVRQAFERLKPRERQLLWLAYVEGSSHQEIADCTGLRAGSIRLLLFRARRRLLDFLRTRLTIKVEK
ncbi:MAG TPA: RNA polymerase sigma factor [Terracidiphilus sp.]|jgi:RNA polymerase sigma-70 factor (ECF subfamily)|nr:RNA polymerase sigma factor [Terracidiphilus sp.]